MRRRTAVLLLGAFVFPGLVSGQTLTPGSRVRFSHPGEGTRTGTVVAFTTDTLEVRLADRAEPTRLPLEQVTRLEVSRGKRRHLWYAGVGLVAGAGLGALGGGATASECQPQEWFCGPAASAAASGVFFGALGGVLGLVAGVVPSESWKPVPLEGRRVSLVVPAEIEGRGVGLRFSF